jgi:chromosome segregation ATPase
MAGHELDALHAALEVRLQALETALADPRQWEQLESLILELARLATDEAEAAARRAILHAQLDSQAQAAAARAEAQKALEAERNASRGLRRELDEARAALSAETQVTSALRGDLDATERAHDAEREAMAAERRQREEALASLQADHDAAIGLRRALDEAERRIAQVEAEKQADVASLEERYEAQLAHERTASARLTETVAGLRRELEAELSEKASREAESAAMQVRVGALEKAQADSARALHDAEARAQTAVRERDALVAEFQNTIGERDALESELQTARERVNAVSTETVARLEALDAEHKRLEAALREAERERQAAAAELGALKKTAAAAEVAATQRLNDLKQSTERQIRDLEAELRRRDFQLQERELQLQERDARIAAMGSQTPAARRAQPPPSPAHVSIPIMTAADEPVLASVDLVSEEDEPVAPPPRSKSPKAAAESYPDSQTRRAARRAFSENIDVLIDGGTAQLVDLSITGAQVLSAAPLKPNRIIKLQLPSADKAVTCKGKIVWARLEPPSAGGTFRYRAGVLFTVVDEAAVDAFMARQAAD